MTSQYHGKLQLCILFVLVASSCFTIIVHSKATNDQPFQSSHTLSFASYYGDHMVLQRGPKRAYIWGYADPVNIGKTVMISLSSKQYDYTKTYKTVITPGPEYVKAIWATHLDPVYNYSPHTIVVTDDSHKIQLEDVLFGDVWLCSGQSNMGFTVYQMFNKTEELKAAPNYNLIRLFSASTKYYKKQLYDLMGVDVKWKLPNKADLAHGNFSYFSAVCWLYGRHLFEHLKRPIGLVESVWGGTPIEAWSTPEDLKFCNIPSKKTLDSHYEMDSHKELDFGRYFHNSSDNKIPLADYMNVANKPYPWTAHSVLWNAMIHPLLNMTLYGIIWYQGENNAGAPDTYNCSFPVMLATWRRSFHIGSGEETDPRVPFGFVQLAPNLPNLTYGYPDIRWHQTVDLGYVPNHILENTFMSVAMDLPDSSSPWGAGHPRSKEPVGWRLALGGLAVAYGVKNITFQGPVPTDFIFETKFPFVTIIFDKNQSEIVIKRMNGFELCCTPNTTVHCNMSGDAYWIPGNYAKTDAHSITLAGDFKDCVITAVRYLWRSSPCDYMKCDVYSKDNDLPAFPFYHKFY